MAAITTKHPQYNRLPPHIPAGAAFLVRKFAAQLFGEAGDILQVCPLGRGDVIGAGCFVQTADLDDGGTAHVFSMEVTNGTVTKTIIDGSTAGQAGGLARPSKAPGTEDGVGFVVPDETYHIRLICDTAATTEQAGDIQVGVEIGGHRDNQLTE